MSVGIGNARHYAFGGDAGFIFARQYADRRAPGAFRPCDEFGAVDGIARGSGRHRFARFDTQAIGNHAKAGQGLQRLGAAFGVQAAR
jgi:hypothetical protein